MHALLSMAALPPMPPMLLLFLRALLLLILHPQARMPLLLLPALYQLTSKPKMVSGGW